MSGIIGLISVSAATVGASEVKMDRLALAASTSVQTVATPTSGKRIRLIGYFLSLGSNSANLAVELYFGTGANIGSDDTKAISNPHLEQTDASEAVVGNFPDGAGPIGAVDDVVSVRFNDTGDNVRVVVIYREE